MDDEIESMQDAGDLSAWVSDIEEELKLSYLISFDELAIWIYAKKYGNSYSYPPECMRIERELHRFSAKKELKEIDGHVKNNKKLRKLLMEYYKIKAPPKALDADCKTEAVISADNRIGIGKHAANSRWSNDPKTYAMCKAYEEWQKANKPSGYRSKLAAHLLQNVDGIRGILVNQKYLAEKFSKWDRGEELPEC
ncbi:MAG: hypothetical protein ACH34X_00015 [Thiolinea sp.]